MGVMDFSKNLLMKQNYLLPLKSGIMQIDFLTKKIKRKQLPPLPRHPLSPVVLVV